MLEEGKKAPAFSLPGAAGRPLALKDCAGKYVVLYFYPKDDTPGCTKEAQGFRDLHQRFSDLGAVVLGVSADDAESHQRFCDKYALPFALLSDHDHKVMEQYGAWGEKVRYGKKSVGVIRSTVLIAPDGKVLKHWKSVSSAEEHPASVLKALEALKTS